MPALSNKWKILTLETNKALWGESFKGLQHTLEGFIIIGERHSLNQKNKTANERNTWLPLNTRKKNHEDILITKNTAIVVTYRSQNITLRKENWTWSLNSSWKLKEILQYHTYLPYREIIGPAFCMFLTLNVMALEKENTVFHLSIH